MSSSNTVAGSMSTPRARHVPRRRRCHRDVAVVGERARDADRKLRAPVGPDGNLDVAADQPTQERPPGGEFDPPGGDRPGDRGALARPQAGLVVGVNRPRPGSNPRGCHRLQRLLDALDQIGDSRVSPDRAASTCDQPTAQIRTVASPEPVASRDPSVENTAEVTGA